MGRNQSPICGPHERVLWSARCARMQAAWLAIDWGLQLFKIALWHNRFPCQSPLVSVQQAAHTNESALSTVCSASMRQDSISSLSARYPVTLLLDHRPHHHPLSVCKPTEISQEIALRSAPEPSVQHALTRLYGTVIQFQSCVGSLGHQLLSPSLPLLSFIFIFFASFCEVKIAFIIARKEIM